PIGVAGHEIGGERGEGDEATVGAERGSEVVTGVATLSVPLVAGAIDAHPLGGAGQPVVDEDVSDPVGVPGYQVGGEGEERHEAPVGADRRERTNGPQTGAAGQRDDLLVAGAVHAHPLGGAGLPVV